MVEISEAAFEAAIERTLLAGGPDAVADEVREPVVSYGAEALPGGYRRRTSDDHDRHLCLIRKDVVDFILATQPKTWARLRQHHGDEIEERFLKRLAREVTRRGTLDVLRHGVKDSGCKLRLAFFRPSSGLNEELERLYRGNLFAVARQLRYSETHDHSLDLVLFLNGLPVFTAELKNPLSGQDVEDAIKQYKTDRDPREPLLTPGRCLAHFAVDPDLVYVSTVSTRLARDKTRFLPFNRGKFGGAGNRPVPPTRQGYATDYLWRKVWGLGGAPRVRARRPAPTPARRRPAVGVADRPGCGRRVGDRLARHRFRVTTRVRSLDGLKVRAIAYGDAEPAGDVVEPNLEEAYLAMIGALGERDQRRGRSGSLLDLAAWDSRK